MNPFRILNETIHPQQKFISQFYLNLNEKKIYFQNISNFICMNFQHNFSLNNNNEIKNKKKFLNWFKIFKISQNKNNNSKKIVSFFYENNFQYSFENILKINAPISKIFTSPINFNLFQFLLNILKKIFTFNFKF